MSKICQWIKKLWPVKDCVWWWCRKLPWVLQ